MEKRIEKAKKVKSMHQDEWLSHSQVVSVGVGFVEEGVIGIIIGVKGKVETIVNKMPDKIDSIPISIQIVNELRAS